MKQHLLVYGLGLALIAGASAALAQRGDPEQRLQRMQEHLDLTAEQVQQIRDIREAGGGREEIQAVLTDEQRATMEEHRARWKDRSGGRYKRTTPPEGEDEEA